MAWVLACLCILQCTEDKLQREAINEKAEKEKAWKDSVYMKEGDCFFTMWIRL